MSVCLSVRLLEETRFYRPLIEMKLRYLWMFSSLFFNKLISYDLFYFSYVQYSNVAARVVRGALKKDLAVDAEKRALINIKFQKWEAGKAVGTYILVGIWYILPHHIFFICIFSYY